MKQLKFLMVALTLLMGISLTSCLDSDSGEYDDVLCLVLVNNYMGFISFEDAAGNTYTPTTASVTQFEAGNSIKISDSKFGWIKGKSIESDTEKKAKNIDFTLTVFSPCHFSQSIVSLNEEALATDAPETAPIMTMSLGGGAIPSLYRKDIVALPIAWRLEDDKDKFKQHNLALACVADEVTPGSTDLVFYVRHDKGTDDKTEVYYSNWYGYDIEEALTMFEEKAGKLPTRLIIKAHESREGSSTEMPQNYTEYTIEYKTSSTN